MYSREFPRRKRSAFSSYLLSFAAGAMLYVVVEELIPEMSQGQHSNVGTVIFCGGLQRDDGAGRSTGVMVWGTEAKSFFKISEND